MNSIFFIFVVGFILGSLITSLIIFFVNLNNKNKFNNKESNLNQDFSNLLEKIKEDYDTLNNQINTAGNNIEKILDDRTEWQTKITTLQKTLTTGTAVTQGNWGQITCENILKKIGFQRGVEYDAQQSYYDSNNNIVKPDFVIHLPNDRHVVIDSKVSLTDWSMYVESTNKNDKEQALKRHEASVLKHIRLLRDSGYDKLKDKKTNKELNTLNNIIMYMPLENAFQALSRFSSKIKEEASKGRITIISSTTLELSLLVVEQMWSLDKQAKNTKASISLATNMYNKAQTLTDSFNTVIKSLNSAQSNMLNAKKQLAEGKDNFISLNNKFKKSLGLITKADINPEDMNKINFIDNKINNNEEN